MKRPAFLIAAALFAFIAQGDDRVRDIQTELKNQGFYYGELDGKATAEMSAAVRRFQIRNGLKVTGQPDDETIAALGLGGKKATPPDPADAPEKPAQWEPTAPKKTPQINPRPPKPESIEDDPAARSKPRDLLIRERERDDRDERTESPRGGPRDPSMVEPPRTIPNATYDPAASLFRGTPYATAPRELQVETISAAQRILQRERLYRGDIDGTAGPMTSEALFNFQEKYDMRRTGRLDLETLARMRLLPRVVPAPGAPPFYNPNQRRDRSVLRDQWVR